MPVITAFVRELQRNLIKLRFVPFLSRDFRIADSLEFNFTSREIDRIINWKDLPSVFDIFLSLSYLLRFFHFTRSSAIERPKALFFYHSAFMHMREVLR